MNDNNDFEKDMEDLRDWQKNQYNPGHYIGTGRVSRPYSELTKQPILLVVAGVIGLLVPLALAFFADISIFGLFPAMLMPFVLVIGGIKRIRRNKSG